MTITQKNGVSNTRLKPKNFKLSAHLDYLTVSGVFDDEKFKQFLTFLDDKYLGIEQGYYFLGDKKYDNKIISLRGIVGGFTKDNEDGLIRTTVQLSGKYFESINVERQWRLLMGLKYAYHVDCSRIDVCVDDKNFNVIPLEKMEKAFYDGNWFKFRKSKYYCNERWENGKLISAKTRYFGSRNSGKLVRIYNHCDECLRFETEFKRQYARLVFNLIASIERDWFDPNKSEDIDCMDAMINWEKGIKNKQLNLILKNISFDVCEEENYMDIILQRIIGSLAVSAIDFRDKSKLKDKSRASVRDTERLDFYQEFINIVGQEITVKLQTEATTLDKKIQWLKRQVSKTLSIISSGLGYEYYPEFMMRLLENGRSKQKLIDYKMIKLIKDNPQMCFH